MAHVWNKLWRGIAVVALWTACVLPLSAAGPNLPPEELLRQAEQWEQRGEWLRACACYDLLPSKERNQPEVRKRYLTCLRHAQQMRRHRDPSYQQQVQQLSLPRTVEAYEEVLTRLHESYVERSKVGLTQLFRNGVEELRAALDDATFCAIFVTARGEAVRDFQTQLRSWWATLKVKQVKEAAQQAALLAQEAWETLGLKPAVVVLELACGACNALDEYTVYLTPGQFTDTYAALTGAVVGVGIGVTAGHEKLVISQVLPGSPAEMAGIKPGDFLLRIGDKLGHTLTAETAAELLRGEPGSLVELEVQPREAMEPRAYTLPRKAVRVPTVSVPRFVGESEWGIGYLQVVGFGETTVQELDDALLKLQSASLRVLILDLRGNPGGLFPVGVEVVRRFVAHGVIASTQGQLREFNKVHEGHGMNVLPVPLVVLVDGDTASVAEMVAAALKDHRRATLVGQPTFGKGMLQRVRRLTVVTAGLQITVAKFYSPGGKSPQGSGIVPDVLVDRTPPETAVDMSEDMQLAAALETARQLAMGR